MLNAGMFITERDDWRTPRDLFSMLNSHRNALVANFCNDFITLHKKNIADVFPWFNPMNDEIIEALSNILDNYEYEATAEDIEISRENFAA